MDVKTQNTKRKLKTMKNNNNNNNKNNNIIIIIIGPRGPCTLVSDLLIV